jgi:hypothetical protein
MRKSATPPTHSSRTGALTRNIGSCPNYVPGALTSLQYYLRQRRPGDRNTRPPRPIDFSLRRCHAPATGLNAALQFPRVFRFHRRAESILQPAEPPCNGSHGKSDHSETEHKRWASSRISVCRRKTVTGAPALVPFAAYTRRRLLSRQANNHDRRFIVGFPAAPGRVERWRFGP